MFQGSILGREKKKKKSSSFELCLTLNVNLKVIMKHLLLKEFIRFLPSEGQFIEEQK